MNHEKITTSFPRNFSNELEKFLGGNYSVTSYYHLSNREVLQTIHSSLLEGIPVPISFAAIDELNKPNYTLHYSIVTGMDLPGNTISVSNVYGYDEVYTVSAFLDALKYKNYENKPVFIKLGIFFGLFEKNTIYLIEENSSIRQY